MIFSTRNESRTRNRRWKQRLRSRTEFVWSRWAGEQEQEWREDEEVELNTKIGPEYPWHILWAYGHIVHELAMHDLVTCSTYRWFVVQHLLTFATTMLLKRYLVFPKVLRNISFSEGYKRIIEGQVCVFFQWQYNSHKLGMSSNFLVSISVLYWTYNFQIIFMYILFWGDQISWVINYGVE